MALDLHWDGSSPWIEAAGRRIPARSLVDGVDSSGPYWGGIIPFETRAALNLSVDVDENGEARAARVELFIPNQYDDGGLSPLGIPCIVRDGELHPCFPKTRDFPEELDFMFTDGWWAELDDARELNRYIDLFGSMPVAH